MTLLFNVNTQYVVKFGKAPAIYVHQMNCGGELVRVYEDERSLVLRTISFTDRFTNTLYPAQIVWFRKLNREFGGIRCIPRETAIITGQPMILDIRRRAAAANMEVEAIP